MALNPKISDPRDWKGKQVWLVGASTGIGAALALALAQRGAHVSVSARPSMALQQSVADAQRSGNPAGGSARDLPLDVTDLASLQAAYGRFEQAPDFVLFCAGTYKPMRAQAFDLTELKRQLDVNYVGALNLLDVILKPMLERRTGHISLVSSVAGYRGLPQALAYGPSKAALTHLAEALYGDLRGSGVAVSVVCPGFVATPLTQQNQFRMPALLTPAQAAAAMLAGYDSGEFEIHFPKRFSRSLKALKLLPDSLYFPLVKRATGL
jgi:NAD(P)-dependent dehydrogenase (short-subunit alcohol dehydrogenase family)